MGWLKGGCHCGDVRFAVEADLGLERVLDCNCSICTKKGILHLIVTRDRFKLEKGEDKLTTYTFGTHTAKHTFCARCGMHPFYTPRSHPDGIDVNVRCLDDVDVRALRVEPFDGLRWEESAPAIQGDVHRSVTQGGRA